MQYDWTEIAQITEKNYLLDVAGSSKTNIILSGQFDEGHLYWFAHLPNISHNSGSIL